MISIIEMLAKLLTTKTGKILGIIILIISIGFFIFSINHKRSRFAKLPVVTMLEKVEFMERLDLITYHSNEVLMLGDPDVLEKMLEKATSDSLEAWDKLKNLTMEMEKEKLEKNTVIFNQSVFEKDLISLQKKSDSSDIKYQEMEDRFDGFLKRLRKYSSAQINTVYGNVIGQAWNNYQTDENVDFKKTDISRKAKRKNESKSMADLQQMWLQVKKERLTEWKQAKSAYDQKETALKHSTNQRVLKKQNKSLEELQKTYQAEQITLLDAKMKADRIRKAIVESRSKFESTLRVKNPRLLAVLPAQVIVYLDLKAIQTRILEDSTIQININSFAFDRVEVLLDSSKHYNVSQRKIELESQENGLYFDVFEQLQLGVDVIKENVLDKAKSSRVISKAKKKAAAYFSSLFNALGYKVVISYDGVPHAKVIAEKTNISNQSNNVQGKDFASNKTSENKSTVQPGITKQDTLRGIDVSHFNGVIDWSEVYSQGINFAYAKATQGTGFVDPKFADNWRAIKAGGLKRGAYHFYVAGESPEMQASHFIKTAGSINKEGFPPMLDLEGSNIGGMTIEAYQKDLQKWLEIIERHYQLKPIIYTDNPFANQYLKNTVFSQYKLWIAEYTKASEPRVPYTWRNEGWHIWQHTADDKLKGISGHVDYDILIR